MAATTQQWTNVEQFRFRSTKPEAVEAAPTETFREVDLTQEQREAYNNIRDWFEREESPLMTLGGFAGTGKSTLISVLGRAYSDISLAFCALTGKAANVLKMKLKAAGVDTDRHYVGTIHRLIYRPVVDDNGKVTGWMRRGFIEHDLLIIDEASMVDERVYADLCRYKIPILAVGDHGQLPPVMSKMNLMSKPMLRLETIHRQAEDNPIIALSAHIRKNGDLPEEYANNDNVQLVPYKYLNNVLEEAYGGSSPLHPLTETAMLCYTNKKRRAMNDVVRWMFLQSRDKTPVAGDQVICLKNAKDTIFNGMRAWVRTLTQAGDHWYNATLDFADDELEVEGLISAHQFQSPDVFRSFEDLQPFGLDVSHWNSVGLLFDFGYALTVHKSQGSGFKYVMLNYDRPNNCSSDDFRRWLYTGVTRASEYLTILVD